MCAQGGGWVPHDQDPTDCAERVRMGAQGGH